MGLQVEFPVPERFIEFGELVYKPVGKDTATESPYHNYWHDLADLSTVEDEGTIGFLEVLRRDRNFVLDKMERHKATLEAFIPTKGVGIFCLCPPTKDFLPDESKIRCFFVDGSVSFFLKPGTWHWLPFSITPTMEFILLLKKRTVEEDIEIAELPTPLQIGI